MEIPVKTLKSGFSLPVYGLGTWEMGGRFEANYANDEADIAAIRSAIDHGITHIDTAEAYGNGHSEELIGSVIKVCDRGNMLISSKVSAGNQKYDDVLRACEASLKRLETDYLDLYLLHRFPELGIDISGTMRAMDRLVTEGMVKNIGVCNMTINRFEVTQSFTQNKLVCNQLHYSVRVREAAKIVEYCQQNDVLVSAWGPLQKGTLQAADVLQEMADKYGKTPYQVALNWIMAQPHVVTIPKTSSVSHLDENLASIGWEMSDADHARLTREFPDQQEISDRDPLDYQADTAA